MVVDEEADVDADADADEDEDVDEGLIPRAEPKVGGCKLLFLWDALLCNDVVGDASPL